MGQAKLRGDYATRKQQAEQRIQTSNPEPVIQPEVETATERRMLPRKAYRMMRRMQVIEAEVEINPEASIKNSRLAKKFVSLDNSLRRTLGLDRRTTNRAVEKTVPEMLNPVSQVSDLNNSERGAETCN
jgi:hypothetical protein